MPFVPFLLASIKSAVLTEVVILGAFFGSVGGDIWAGRSLFQSYAAGRGAAVGRFWGTISKLAVGAVIFVLLSVAAFL